MSHCDTVSLPVAALITPAKRETKRGTKRGTKRVGEPSQRRGAWIAQWVGRYDINL